MRGESITFERECFVHIQSRPQIAIMTGGYTISHSLNFCAGDNVLFYKMMAVMVTMMMNKKYCVILRKKNSFL